MHLDLERLHRWIDGELPPDERGVVHAHLAGCTACSARAEQARDEWSQVLRRLQAIDHPVPERSATRLELWHRPTPWLRRAAGIVVVTALAGAAYAAPGSPVRRWLDAVVFRSPPPAGSESSAPGAAQAPQAGGAAAAGIAVEPGESLVIQFAYGQSAGVLRVRLTSDPRVTVRAPNGAATYASAVDRLMIVNAEATADFDIDVPNAAPHVEIRVAHRTVLVKHGSRIITDAAAIAGGGYAISLAAR
jgi:anti-sigma factor RsiW